MPTRRSYCREWFGETACLRRKRRAADSFVLRATNLPIALFSPNSKIWRRDLLQPESPAVELIPSSRAQWDAQYSPDGKRIAFASIRSGLQGVWISSDDGSNLVQISNPNYVSGSPQWSPDGNRIAFDSHPRTTGKYMWPTWPNGSPENWSQISPT